MAEPSKQKDTPEQAARTLLTVTMRALNDRLIPLHAAPDAAQRLAASYNLEGLDSSIARTIHVQMRLPSREEVKDHVLKMLKIFYPTDVALPALDKALDAYFDGNAANPWQTTLQHGKTSLQLEGVPHNSSKHQGQLVLKSRSYRNFEESQKRGVEMVIDGRLFVGWDGEVIADNLGAITELTQVMNRIDQKESDKALTFAERIRFGSTSFMGVNKNRSITVNNTYLTAARAQGASLHESILLHEKEHIVNGDTEHSSAIQFLHTQLAPFVSILDSLKTLQEPKGARSILMSCDGDFEAAQQFIQNIDLWCKAAENALTPILRHLQANPLLTNTDAVEIAAHLNPASTLRRHIMKTPKLSQQRVAIVRIDHDLESAAAAFDVKKGANDTAAFAACKPDEMKIIAASLESVLTKHQRFLDALQTAEHISTAVVHSKEFRADIYAVEHAEHPERVGPALAILEVLDTAEEFKRLTEIPDDLLREELLRRGTFAPAQLDKEVTEFDALPAEERRAFAISVGAIAADETEVGVRFLPLELALDNVSLKTSRTHPKSTDRVELAETYAEALGFPPGDEAPATSHAQAVRSRKNAPSSPSR